MSTGNSQAIWFFNPSAMLGPIRKNPSGGLIWDLIVVLREPQTGRSDIITEVLVNILDTDNLATAKGKANQAAKTTGLQRDFNVVNVTSFVMETQPV